MSFVPFAPDISQPIQRVCRYPLLFAELLNCTPVCDCPQSHMEIEDTLVRLREATAEINQATNDSKIKATLEKTWILQDRLVFSGQVSSSPQIKRDMLTVTRSLMRCPRRRSGRSVISDFVAPCMSAGRLKKV